MNKRPTRADVARLAGVSTTTVSYVMNDGPRQVSPETRQRVLSAIQTLGYRPHAIARSLKTGSTQTVALLVQSLLQTFTAYLITAVEEQLASRDYGLILASSHEDLSREKQMLNVLVDQSIDGLLYIPASQHNAEDVTAIIDAGVPVVLMDRTLPDVPADVVMTDNVAAARQVTEHLIARGCQQILCITFSTEASSALDRVEGYRQALIAHQLPFDPAWVLVADYVSSFTQQFDEALLTHVQQHGLPDGIICTTDDFIIRTIKVLKANGVQVPAQVMIGGGFVYSPWNEILDTPLPTVHQDFETMAQRAVDFLIERINGDDSPPRTELIAAEFAPRS